MSKRAGSIRAGLAAIAAVALLALAAPSAWASPANDDFAAAQALPPAVPAEASGDTSGATEQAGEPDHAGAGGAHSVWFTWTPSESGRVGIPTNNCFSSFQPALAVYTGEAVDALTPVASSEGLTPVCFGEGPQVEWDAAAGTTYRIAVDGSGEASGSFSFTIQGKPANDDFADAGTVAGALPASAFGTTRFASAEAGEPQHAGQPGGHSVWWNWTPEASGPVVVSTCSSFYALDTTLGVYTGDSVDALTKVAANDDAPQTLGFPGCAPSNSEVRFEAVAGTTYRIAVDSTDDTVGRFSLELRGRPANDDFAQPQVLDSAMPGSANGNDDLATAEAGEPEHGGAPAAQSVWYSWTPANSRHISLTACGQGEEPPELTLAVYTGASLAALTRVAGSDDGPNQTCSSESAEAGFDAVAGTTYRIAVDSPDGGGRFSLQFSGAPANDDFRTRKRSIRPCRPAPSARRRRRPSSRLSLSTAAFRDRTASGTRGPRRAAARWRSPTARTTKTRPSPCSASTVAARWRRSKRWRGRLAVRPAARTAPKS